MSTRLRDATHLQGVKSLPGAPGYSTQAFLVHFSTCITSAPDDQKAATVGVDVVQQSTRLIAGLYVAGGFCSAPSHSGNHNHIGRIEGETHW